MKNVFAGIALLATVVVVLASCSKDHNPPNPPGGGGHPDPEIDKVVVTAAGDSASIVDKFNEFKQLAGDPVNTAPHAQGGRREVNWDGVPANLTNNNNFPFDFFGSFDPAAANGRKRGLVYEKDGIFRIDSTDFSEIDRSYAAQFEPFSRKRLFADIDDNVTDITFNVPGSDTAAFVNAFGVIFSDVDVSNYTTVEFFNKNRSLGVFKAQEAPQGFSFLGVAFANEKVTRIRITAGNGTLGAGVKDISDGGAYDLVVMDDFIYSEPRAIK